MTDQVQIALIASIGPTIIGIIGALHQYKTGQNVKRLETQTNSIKDALVASTALAAHAEGMKDQKILTSAEAAAPVKNVAPPANPA